MTGLKTQCKNCNGEGFVDDGSEHLEIINGEHTCDVCYGKGEIEN